MQEPKQHSKLQEVLDYAAKWSIMPPNGRLCRQMVDYAAKWSIMPPNGLIMPPNGRLCRQMVDYAAKWSIMPPNGRLCRQMVAAHLVVLEWFITKSTLCQAVPMSTHFGKIALWGMPGSGFQKPNKQIEMYCTYKHEIMDNRQAMIMSSRNSSDSPGVCLIQASARHDKM
ncbi:unnamed protein product [Polarella glacialis]|uniref:Uncharacterized protein n=1 Tax=Polarella glacialis TaxID=89957 RepID=A0A813JJF5_POLGL|nr:unnamed protein product [Polarella glacialis]